VRSDKFKRGVQTLTYLPHLSPPSLSADWCSILFACGRHQPAARFCGPEGDFVYDRARYFRSIYIGSGIWQEVGWGSIIYLAALSGIDQELYEACRIDGAGKFRQLLTVTLPALRPPSLSFSS
jgi:putative aldouronate transport system permease protein